MITIQQAVFQARYALQKGTVPLAQKAPDSCIAQIAPQIHAKCTQSLSRDQLQDFTEQELLRQFSFGQAPQNGIA